MSRIGSTMRSAKTKARTPPKLMPPFQRIAASGTLPIEQTKLRIATAGPTTGPRASPASCGRRGRASARNARAPRPRARPRRAGRRRCRSSRVGARRGGAHAAGDAERAWRVVGEQATQLRLRDDGLHDAGEREAEDQRPEDLPEHAERKRECLSELVPEHRWHATEDGDGSYGTADSSAPLLRSGSFASRLLLRE